MRPMLAFTLALLLVLPASALRAAINPAHFQSPASEQLRLREVARVVSDSSADGTRAITEQYALVRQTAEEERRRTVETMNQVYTQTTSETEPIFHHAQERFAEAAKGLRRMYEQSSDETQSLVQDAQERFAEAAKGMRRMYEESSDETQTMFREPTERFAETVQDMKQMAAEMQRELEATRTELRRGVFELPQETAENAAQNDRSSSPSGRSATAARVASSSRMPKS